MRAIILQPVFFASSFFLVIFTNSIVAMNDKTFDIENVYSVVKDHKDLVNVIPDEMATSFPVPIFADKNNNKKTQFKFFHYYMTRSSASGPGKSIISSPRQITLVSYPELSIIKTEKASSQSFRVEWDDSKPVGEYVSNADISVEKKIERRKKFFKLYNYILPLYISNSISHNENDKKSLKEFIELFQLLGHPPLYPYYKSLNPDFFQWLDENSQ